MGSLKQILTTLDMIVMVFLIVTVVLQNKNSGLSNVFGGGGSIATTRRGGDKWLFYATIVLGILFAGISFSLLFVS